MSGGGFGAWISERTPLGAIGDFLRRKSVPEHRHTAWYLFGGLTLFLFGIQVVSGVLLTVYYQPAPETAHESVSGIVTDVRFGWALRSIHLWSSHLVILAASIHMASKFFFKAYRRPRELTWVSGVLLLLFLLAFAFTGHLLPWDTTGYFATQIGAEIPRTLPVVGPFIVNLIRGGSEFVEAVALTRMYSLHTVILPLLSIVIIAFHVIQNQFTGSAAPPGTKPTGAIPFFPEFLYRDLLAWLTAVMLLFSLAVFFPPALGGKADVLASPPQGIHPEWYFLPLFQTIRLLPGMIAGIHTEVLLNSVVALFLIALFILPWIDKRGGRAFAAAGIAVMLYAAAAIAMTYMGL